MYYHVHLDTVLVDAVSECLRARHFFLSRCDLTRLLFPARNVFVESQRIRDVWQITIKTMFGGFCCLAILLIKYSRSSFIMKHRSILGGRVLIRCQEFPDNLSSSSPLKTSEPKLRHQYLGMRICCVVKLSSKSLPTAPATDNITPRCDAHKQHWFKKRWLENN